MKKLALALLIGMVFAATFAGMAYTAELAVEDDGPIPRPKTPFFNLALIAEVVGMEPDVLRQAFADGQSLADVIADQGLDESAVLADLLAAAVGKVKAAHEAGILTDNQAEKLLKRLENSDFGTDWMDKFPFRPTLRQKIWNRVREHPGILLDDVAVVLDISPEDLRKALADGQTLRDILEAEGLDEEQAFESVKAALITRFEQVVENKKLAADRAEQILEKMGEDEFGIKMWERLLEWERPRQRQVWMRPALRRVVGRLRQP